MKYEDQSLMNPPLQKLLEKIPQKYEAVLAVTRRAKQIIREQRLNPNAFSAEELKLKPISIALNDIIEGKVDKEALMAPDLTFDELEAPAETLFIEDEGFPHLTEEPHDAEPLAAEGEDDLDDLADVDDLFDFGADDEDE